MASLDAFRLVQDHLSAKSRLKLARVDQELHDVGVRWEDVKDVHITKFGASIKGTDSLTSPSVAILNQKTSEALANVLALCPHARNLYAEFKLSESDVEVLQKRAATIQQLYLAIDNACVDPPLKNLLMKRLLSLHILKTVNTKSALAYELTPAHVVALFSASLRNVCFTGVHLNALVFEALLELKRLQSLDLIGCLVDSKVGAAYIERFAQLEELDDISLPPSLFSFYTSKETVSFSLRNLPVTKLSAYMEIYEADLFLRQLTNFVPKNLKTLVVHGNHVRLAQCPKAAKFDSPIEIVLADDSQVTAGTFASGTELIERFVWAPPYFYRENAPLGWKFDVAIEKARQKREKELRTQQARRNPFMMFQQAFGLQGAAPLEPMVVLPNGAIGQNNVAANQPNPPPPPPQQQAAPAAPPPPQPQAANVDLGGLFGAPFGAAMIPLGPDQALLEQMFMGGMGFNPGLVGPAAPAPNLPQPAGLQQVVAPITQQPPPPQPQNQAQPPVPQNQSQAPRNDAAAPPIVQNPAQPPNQANLLRDRAQAEMEQVLDITDQLIAGLFGFEPPPRAAAPAAAVVGGAQAQGAPIVANNPPPPPAPIQAQPMETTRTIPIERAQTTTSVPTVTTPGAQPLPPAIQAAALQAFLDDMSDSSSSSLRSASLHSPRQNNQTPPGIATTTPTNRSQLTTPTVARVDTGTNQSAASAARSTPASTISAATSTTRTARLNTQTTNSNATRRNTPSASTNSSASRSNGSVSGTQRTSLFGPPQPSTGQRLDRPNTTPTRRTNPIAITRSPSPATNRSQPPATVIRTGTGPSTNRSVSRSPSAGPPSFVSSTRTARLKTSNNTSRSVGSTSAGSLFQNNRSAATPGTGTASGSTSSSSSSSQAASTPRVAAVRSAASTNATMQPQQLGNNNTNTRSSSAGSTSNGTNSSTRR